MLNCVHSFHTFWNRTTNPLKSKAWWAMHMWREFDVEMAEVVGLTSLRPRRSEIALYYIAEENLGAVFHLSNFVKACEMVLGKISAYTSGKRDREITSVTSVVWIRPVQSPTKYWFKWLKREINHANPAQEVWPVSGFGRKFNFQVVSGTGIAMKTEQVALKSRV